MRGTTLNTKIHPTQPRGGHPSHSNLVRGKLTSPTPNPAGDGTSGLTSYPRRRSKVSEATCLRPQRSAQLDWYKEDCFTSHSSVVFLMISCQKLKWSETVDLLVVLKKPGLARYLVSSKKLLLLFFQIASHICLKEPYNDF